MENLWPLVIMIPVFILFARYAVSGKARDRAVQSVFGEILEEHQLGDTPINRGQIRGTQSLRLLKCQDADEIFYVLETTDKTFASVNTTWAKINNDTLGQIIKITQS